MTIFVGDFESLNDVVSLFRIALEELDDCKILLAHYYAEDYQGYAFVLLDKNGNLFEVNAAHCSCYGLEEQWSLEETSYESLKYRLEKGNCFAPFKKHILDLINDRQA